MGYVDTAILGGHHLVQHGVGSEFCADKWKCPGPFDPNGLWGVLPSILHVMLGFTIGRVVKLYAGRGTAAVCRRLLIWAVPWVVVGIALDRGHLIPISKTMWSVSFVCWTSGLVALLLMLFFLLVDADRPLGRRCAEWRGGILRSTGQNSIAL